MVVFPREIHHLVVEFGVVIRTVGEVYNEVVFLVVFLEEAGY
jgi:hypothetical protein